MSDNDFDFELDLLVPWDIPIEYLLDDKQQEKITKALLFLLQSLKETSIEKALSLIDSGLVSLGNIETKSAEITYTKTPLKDWEITDYDCYFKINHVESEEPAICLVKGLLTNCRAFFLLCQSCNSLNPDQIKIQKTGFASYAYLLARNFQLDI